jgi:DNA-binding NtrC family response regulator
MARIGILSLSESFASLWTELAAALGAEAIVTDGPLDVLRTETFAAVVVSAAGVEDKAAKVLGEVRAAGLEEVAVVGAVSDHRFAVSLLRAGASEYFALPPDLQLLRSWLGERVERQTAMVRAQAMSEAARQHYDFSRLVGESAQLRAALDRASRVIPHGSATVLVTGETGTGKELLARAIHYNGPRRGQPFVEINCSAIPATLLEAELFGFEAGAFTDARAAKPGLFEAAHGGTLFLDEIGDLPVDLQAKLLKVLDGMEIRRLGSVRPVRVDVRVIAATHADLAAAVREGRFREDLFYRLHVVPIHLPPLRDRGEDVLLLATHFLAEFCAAYGVARPVLNGDARGVLLRHTWPGNVRELRNSIERAVLLGSGTLEPSDLLDNSGLQVPSAIPFPAKMDEIEQMAARVMVERLGGNKSAAAEALGISRSRLYRLLDHEP